VKLIAEPWDIGEGGYQVGNFPPLWSEWNGKYRDTVRDYWRGQDRTLSEFAYRFTGSSDLYASSGRRPYASINFVTCHDGFTLRDLVSYDKKHNRMNGERNRDGESHNRSWNCGVEGETDIEEVLTLRARQQRNFLATLFLSQGVPMLLAGDEFGKTQLGNNNTYCQDNDLSWVNWQALDRPLLAYVRRLIALSREHAVFRRRRWLQGHSHRGSELHDIGWFRPDGQQMQDEDWETGYAKSLAVFLSGEGIPSRDRRGRPVIDDDFYLAFNAHHEPMEFTLPERISRAWVVTLDTSEASGEPGEERAERRYLPGERIEALDRSLIMLQSKRSVAPAPVDLSTPA
jgi:glycogen operon protein